MTVRLGWKCVFTIRDSVLNCGMVLGVGELVDGVDALVCGLRFGPVFAHREDIFLERFAKVWMAIRNKVPCRCSWPQDGPGRGNNRDNAKAGCFTILF